MVWTLFTPQQQRGAQLHNRSDKVSQQGEAPGEATHDRGAQEHDLPGGTAAPKGRYPASRIEDRAGDISPTAGDPRVEWDDVIQPERQVGEASHDLSDEQPPEGK
jgi:hypothetical protein